MNLASLTLIHYHPASSPTSPQDPSFITVESMSRETMLADGIGMDFVVQQIAPRMHGGRNRERQGGRGGSMASLTEGQIEPKVICSLSLLRWASITESYGGASHDV